MPLYLLKKTWWSVAGRFDFLLRWGGCHRLRCCGFLVLRRFRRFRRRRLWRRTLRLQSGKQILVPFAFFFPKLVQNGRTLFLGDRRQSSNLCIRCLDAPGQDLLLCSGHRFLSGIYALRVFFGTSHRLFSNAVLGSNALTGSGFCENVVIFDHIFVFHVCCREVRPPPAWSIRTLCPEETSFVPG